MLAWILQDAGRDPGFLIGGIPANFGTSARAGLGAPFVIEADEYDTAFFDKRAKFVHYRPRHLALTNLEFDHADIYPDLASIQRQFHHLVRTVPASGRITWNAAAPRSRQRSRWARGRRSRGSRASGRPSGARASCPPTAARSRCCIATRRSASCAGRMIGLHNVENGLAAIACAAGMGVLPAQAAAALARFAGVKRRLELRGEAGGVRVYDDFAHHPTAVAITIDGLRRQAGGGRIVAVLEPRSNTMRLGVHREELAEALAGADDVWLYQPVGLDWNLDDVAEKLGTKARILGEVPALVAALAADLRAGDRVLVMSNGGFGGLHERLIAALRARAA